MQSSPWEQQHQRNGVSAKFAAVCLKTHFQEKECDKRLNYCCGFRLDGDRHSTGPTISPWSDRLLFMRAAPLLCPTTHSPKQCIYSLGRCTWELHCPASVDFWESALFHWRDVYCMMLAIINCCNAIFGEGRANIGCCRTVFGHNFSTH